MSKPDLESPVGQWVAEHPNTSHLFEAFQIDYCCGGDKSLRQACMERQLDADNVLRQLTDAAAESAAESAERWNAATLTSLCDHIEATHHAYLRSELPRLQAMIAKVVEVHGAHHRELTEVAQAFADLQAELGPHMFKEEQILFPALRRLEQASASVSFPFGSVANPIRMMEHEHDNAGNALSRIRRATSDYQVPHDACNTYRAMMDGLRRLELDLHQHIHKENNILFPKAVRKEQGVPHS